MDTREQSCSSYNRSQSHHPYSHGHDQSLAIVINSICIFTIMIGPINTNNRPIWMLPPFAIYYDRFNLDHQNQSNLYPCHHD